MLIDSFGRRLDYLRVSVTDRCNMRCIYCMPSSGVEWKPHDSILRFEELLRLCSIMVELGIFNIRVTGGEALVRRGTVAFLQSLKALPGLQRLTLTTNGFLLDANLDEIANTLDGINISLDALDAERFATITNYTKEGPGEIIRLVDRLLEKKLVVKINCVPIRGFNEEEILPLAALAKDRNIAVRFIELMPLGSAELLEPVYGVAEQLEKAYGSLIPCDDVLGSGPAVYYSLPGFTGKIGFIKAMSQGFCESCNRLRLTSEGLLKPCLADEQCLDLKELLRSGASDREIGASINDAIAHKPRFHAFSEMIPAVSGASVSGVRKPRKAGMFRTGG